MRRACLLLARVVSVVLGLLSSWFAPCATAHADPGYYVVTAYDNEGQRSVDLRYWSVKRSGRPEKIWPELGFGYGVNSRWYTELLYSTIGPSNWDIVPSYLNWQNEILLTQGEWPVDVAVHAMLMREIGYGAHYSLEYGPVLQTDIGRNQLNANLFFERSFEGEEATPIQLKYQWQVRHRWQHWMDFGLQGFGELGAWDHWGDASHQSHRAGPALFGRIDLGQGQGAKQSLLYQAAVLVGSVYNRRARMFTLRLQYAF